MESILLKIRENNVEKGILPSENEVIDRLLGRSTEMVALYDELAVKLSVDQQEHLWDGLLGVAAFWNLESSRELRENRKNLEEINRKISSQAHELASLIQQRQEICETTSFSAYEDYHPLHWLHRAGESNPLYQSYVEDKLDALSNQFDLKYWPENYDVVVAIGTYADEAKVYVNDAWTDELLASPKHSQADYLRVILKMIDDKKKMGGPSYLLPSEFKLSDKALATFVNCTLDHAPKNLVTAENVKRSRQNIRKGRS